MRPLIHCLKRKPDWHRAFSHSARNAIVKDIRELPDRISPRYQPTSHNDLLCLEWPSPPRNVLLIKKDKAPEVTAALIEYAKHIHATYPAISLIFEPATAHALASALPFPIYAPPPPSPSRLAPTAAADDAGGDLYYLYPAKVDVTCTLGGDGTILHAASLFATARSVPPILAFSMGTLGFLGEWKFGEHKRAFRDVVVSGARAPGPAAAAAAAAEPVLGRGPAGVGTVTAAAAGLAGEGGGAARGADADADVEKRKEEEGREKMVDEMEAGAAAAAIATSPSTGSTTTMMGADASTAAATTTGLLTGWSSIRGRAMGAARGARVLLRNRLKVGVFAPGGRRISPDRLSEGATTSRTGATTGTTAAAEAAARRRKGGEGGGGWSDGAGDVYAMNEVIIHRGRDPHLAIVDVLVGGRYLTEAVADGMIISTPTGSTAYSLSSGGSIVHPLVSSLLLTPICPRSLSFRPLVLPANTPITLRLSEKNRGREVEVSIDGVRRSEGMGVGMEVRVQGEEIQDGQGAWVGGVPSIVRGNVGAESTGDDHWVGGLNGLLKFNYPFGEDG
ncbi:MAG: NADH kinase pos5 [Bathelium mastoideum]|nr:MAG: NADH kinase pos5 [Bathelium mastoideum]